MDRDFEALEPNTKLVVDITFIGTGEGWHLCAVLDLFSHKIVGWSMSSVQDRHMVLKAMMMACWQRPHRSPVNLHSGRGTQFASADYQQILKDHHPTSSMSAVGHCGDNAAMEGFFGLLKRERMQRRPNAKDQAFRLLTQPSVETK